MPVVAVVAAALLLTGCGVIPGIGPDPRPEATAVAEVVCGDSPDEYVEGGRVPAGFEATAVLRCDPYAAREYEDGLWSGVLVERLEGDLEAVLAALAVSSDPRSLGPCPAIGYMVPVIWIEAADGRVVRASLPRTGCGAPKEVGLDAALSTLSVTDERFEQVTLIESRAALSAGCPSQANLLLLADAGTDFDDAVAVPPVATADVELVPFPVPEFADPSSISGLRVCEYGAAPPGSSLAPALAGTADFTDMHELGAADARTVLEAVSAAAPAAPCGRTATRFSVAYDLAAAPAPPPETEGISASVMVAAPSISLELDGCRRLVGPDFRPLAAPSELIALLTPST